MDFQHYNGYDAVVFTSEGVSGIPAIAGHLLRFSVHYEATPWNLEWDGSPTVFRGVRAKIDLGPERVRLGVVEPERPLIISHDKYPQASTLLFEIFLTTWQIERLESIRQGNGLEFLLRLSGERIAKDGHMTVDADLRINVSQSDWIAVLRAMEFGDYLLCEIPIEFGENVGLREAWAALDNARRLLYQGHYKNVVAECRTALEATLKELKPEKRVVAAVKQKNQTHLEMRKEDRILNLCDAVRHVAQLGVHIDATKQYVDFSRREAILIYSATAATIANLGDQHIGDGTT